MVGDSLRYRQSIKVDDSTSSRQPKTGSIAVDKRMAFDPWLFSSLISLNSGLYLEDFLYAGVCRNYCLLSTVVEMIHDLGRQL